MVAIQKIITAAKNAGRTVLTELESKHILTEAGIPCVIGRVATTKHEAVGFADEITYPVVLKISSPDITHKSDAQGVKTNIRDRAQVEASFESIVASCRERYPNADIEGVLVQPMAPAGVEIIIGMTQDSQFGPVIMFGLGGVLVEVLNDVAFRVVPLEPHDAGALIREIKGYKLLEGYRGAEPVDVNYLEQMIVRLSRLIDATPQIAELDMNPVFAYRDGAIVVDARVVLK